MGTDIDTTADDDDALAALADPPSITLIPPAVCPVFLGLNRSFPVILCWHRTRRGLSQTDLALLIGVNRTYISRIENGFYMPTMKSVERIAAALGTTVGMMVMACEVLMADNSRQDAVIDD